MPLPYSLFLLPLLLTPSSSLFSLPLPPPSSHFSYFLTVDPVQAIFASKFADAIFECPTCTSLITLNNSLIGKWSPPLNATLSRSPYFNKSRYFDGTLWLPNQNYSYPYAFVNLAVGVNKTLNSPKSASFGSTFYGHFLNGPNCPTNVAQINLQQGTFGTMPNSTLEAMTYINLLSNTLVDPSLSMYTVQGAVSTFGLLDFSLTTGNQFISFILTMITVIVFNVMWTLSVWRLAYERTTGIAKLLKSIGVCPRHPLYPPFVHRFLAHLFTLFHAFDNLLTQSPLFPLSPHTHRRYTAVPTTSACMSPTSLYSPLFPSSPWLSQSN